MQEIIAIGNDFNLNNDHQSDEQTLRFHQEGSEKCKTCRMDMGEVVEQRRFDRVQYGFVSEIDLSMAHPIVIALRGDFVGRLDLGKQYGLAGYVRMSIDGGLLSKLLPTAISYLDIM